MIKEPKLRKDGRCARCGKQRKMPTSHHSSINMATYQLDPFCSTVCARAYYGVKNGATTSI